MSRILHTSTVHKAVSLADQGNAAHCQYCGVHNIKHTLNLWKFALRDHLNNDSQATMPCKNIGTNDKFCRKVALLRYTERLKFRLQSWSSA